MNYRFRHALKMRVSCAAWFSLRRPVGRLIAKSIVTAPPFFRIGLIHSIHWRSSNQRAPHDSFSGSLTSPAR